MSNHKVPVVRVEEILPHPNADRLEIIPVFGFQVVSGKGQFKVGDLAYYIPPDSIVPERAEYKFVWERDGGGNLREWKESEQPVPEKWRRVTVKRLRKEWSEGLLMPTIEAYRDTLNGIDFYKPADYALLRDNGNEGNQIQVREGDDVAEFLGITHWNPPEDQEDREPSSKQSKTRPRSLKGWLHFIKNWSIKIITLGQYDPWGELGGSNEKAPKNTPPIYDVENWKHYKDAFIPGEEVVASEKIHGSNGRFLYQPGLLGGEGRMYAGSRKLWKKQGSTNIWRKILQHNDHIETWCRAHPGYVLYGEAVPTQGGFEYGHKKEEPWLYAFDIRNPEGEWVAYDEARALTAGYGIEWAPLLYRGPYDIEKISALVDGKTKTGANHIREGLVIRTYPERHLRGLGRVQLKIVSNDYLKKEQ